MKNHDANGHLRLAVDNVMELENLHDTIGANLEQPNKQGVKKLLGRNNRNLKKNLHKYIHSFGVEDIEGLMSALDFLLELHSRECYIIGYIDCLKGKEQQNIICKNS